MVYEHSLNAQYQQHHTIGMSRGGGCTTIVSSPTSAVDEDGGPEDGTQSQSFAPATPVGPPGDTGSRLSSVTMYQRRAQFRPGILFGQVRALLATCEGRPP